MGEQLFRSVTPACAACHSIAPGVNLAGPSLAGLSARTEQLLASGQYNGKAKDLAGYIRESITDPSAHLVPGPMYSGDGVSFMPRINIFLVFFATCDVLGRLKRNDFDS